MIDLIDSIGNEYRGFRAALRSFFVEDQARFLINENTYRITKISGALNGFEIDQSLYTNDPIMVGNVIQIKNMNNPYIVYHVKVEKETSYDESEWNEYISDTNGIDLSSISINTDPSLLLCILFLDMDGVLMPDRFNSHMGDIIKDKLVELHGKKDLKKYTDLEWAIAHSHLLDKRAVSMLNALLLRLNKICRVRIVISSSWREHGTENDVINAMFKSQPFSRFIIGRTPISNKNRGKQIQEWLSSNRVDRYAILDDSDDHISNLHPNNLIEIDTSYLLSRLDIIKAYSILNH